ncbi:MAG TPA: peroxiredoxin [Polyangiaceae bacterium]|jgi:peroxiredoxin Q/BCP
MTRSVCSVLCAFALACGSSEAPPATPTAATATATSATPTEAAPIAEGQPAPAFSVTASDGTKIDSAALAGKPIVLYFYPKDETPGCTTEACAFRDAWTALEKSGVVLVGISVDSDESHRAFAAHHKLPFHLVSDPKLELAKRFGVASKTIDNLGTILMRQTIVIGADGRIKKIYRTVEPTKHAAEIEADLGVATSA